MKELALHWKIIISIVLGVFFVLLVLNISKEVLNSFFQVNQGITRTTRSLDNKNTETYQAFEKVDEGSLSKVITEEMMSDGYTGKGTYTYSDGTVKEGLWIDGEFLGEE